MFNKLTLFGLIATFIFSSCKKSEEIEITDFNPLSNFVFTGDTLNLDMDLSNVISDGIKIPSISQTKSGYFKISFKVKNNGEKATKFAYKFFYQNESYKFDEKLKNGTYNELAGQNFYGSWENAKDSFHLSVIIPNDNNFYTIVDSFKIQGNPRDEIRYFGGETKNIQLSENIVGKTVEEIKSNTEWFDAIKKKAAQNNVPLEQQLIDDAEWLIHENSVNGNHNNRWKRNPRVGKYNFALALSKESDLKNIPKHLKDITISENETFKNPFFDLLNNTKEKSKMIVINSNKHLKTSAKMNPGSGLYVDESKYNKNLEMSYYDKQHNSSDKLYKSAHFAQFYHTIDEGVKFKNVPLAYDVVGDNYTRKQYDESFSKYKTDNSKEDFFKISKYPGKTVKSDKKNDKIIIKTPGNYTNLDLKKENVGVISRIGMSFGKFTAKIKFPAIISKENVWNGLTCAYWMISQEDKAWNKRSDCNNAGYLSKAIEGKDSPRSKSSNYSEIDFEILKTSQHWPKLSYPKGTKVPKDKPKFNREIIVTCTNWDLACRSPENFSIGAKSLLHGNNSYIIHRWDDWHKILSIKKAMNHDEMFNKPFYYQIDWSPERIIWRIGKDKNHLFEIAYMDRKVSNIPDNQMLVVVTQEFHISQWWPLSPFLQEMVPYPKKDIVGEILSLEIE